MSDDKMNLPEDVPDTMTLEELHEKHFPNLPLETLAYMMPNRPRRGGVQINLFPKKEDTFAYHRAVREREGYVPILKDSGERREFPTGAVRDRSVGKGRFDLLSTQMLLRLARHYEAGAIKYSDRNWEKGMPLSVYVDAAMRHLTKYIAGWNDEDHLAAVIWNIAAIMFMEDKQPNLMDLPERSDVQHNIQKWVIRKPEDA